MQHKIELTSFIYNSSNNEDFKVRTFEDVDHEVWFVARDVCEVLELSDTSNTCARLDEDERMVRRLFVSSKMRDVLMVSESGLYSLIFTSRKPEARKFRKWVTAEVLPTIRKTGHYELQDGTDQSNKSAIVPVGVTDCRSILTLNAKRGIPQGVLKATEKLLDKTELDEFQKTLALDAVIQQYTGVSLLSLAGIRPVKRVTEDEDNAATLIQTTWSFECPYPKAYTCEWEYKN